MAEKCPNLTHLNLSGNKIKDLSTIEPLVSHWGPPLSTGVGGIDIREYYFCICITCFFVFTLNVCHEIESGLLLLVRP